MTITLKPHKELLCRDSDQRGSKQAGSLHSVAQIFSAISFRQKRKPCMLNREDFHCCLKRNKSQFKALFRLMIVSLGNSIRYISQSTSLRPSTSSASKLIAVHKTFEFTSSCRQSESDMVAGLATRWFLVIKRWKVKK